MGRCCTFVRGLTPRGSDRTIQETRLLFTEPAFLFLFLPLLLGLYFLGGRWWRNLILLAASLAFYAWGEKAYVVVMLGSIAFNYAMGLAIERAHIRRQSTGLMLASAVAGNLLLLAAFKYTNFLVDNLNGLIASLGAAPLEVSKVHLPIGISFFTFQAMSYVIDVHRREVKANANPLEVALYIALFPQLIAGPIVRYKDVAAQILVRTVTREGFAYGIRRFVIGLGKKMVIANALALPADQIFAAPVEQLPFGVAWLGAVCYTLQIYFDFSGYSDMAIGLGHMFGFRFLENFNYPYISRSITEFWRRWHISLSTWFRDYLYIPLGGNRLRASMVYRNLLIVFFLCGLWHGAAWTFVIWGLFHGAFLVVERLGWSRVLDRLPTLARSLYVMLVVIVGWVFFRAETLGQAGSYLTAMAGLGHATGLEYHADMWLNNEVWLALVLGIVGATPIMPWAVVKVEALIERLPARRSGWLAGVGEIAGLIFCGVVLLYCMMLSAAGTYNPFIYFRF